MTERTTTIDGAVVTESQLREALGRLERPKPVSEHGMLVQGWGGYIYLQLDRERVRAALKSADVDAASGTEAYVCVDTSGGIGYDFAGMPVLGCVTGFTHRKA